jgi:hypothetical protein
MASSAAVYVGVEVTPKTSEIFTSGGEAFDASSRNLLKCRES